MDTAHTMDLIKILWTNTLTQDSFCRMQIKVEE